MKNFTGKQIDELCAATEDFVADVLCQKVEEMGNCAPDSPEFESALYATLRTVAHKIHIQDIGFGKGRDGKYVLLDKSGKKPEAKPDDEDESKSTELDEDMAEEISELIAKIVAAAKKYATDKDDFSTTLSSAAMTILIVGGPSAMANVVMHLMELV